MYSIKLENITKKFTGKTIFENYNLSIKKGEYVCIAGESGKGKTTLLNIMGMLDYPDNGNVVICNNHNPKLNSKIGKLLLKNEIAYVFQNYGLVEDRTVKYNLEISAEFSKKNKENDYINALNKVGLDKQILKQKVFELSGGEQQRVALARLYIKNFSIILADEPTGSLDAANRDNVMSVFSELHKEGKTIIIVSHDKEVQKCASRTIKL